MNQNEETRQRGALPNWLSVSLITVFSVLLIPCFGFFLFFPAIHHPTWQEYIFVVAMYSYPPMLAASMFLRAKKPLLVLLPLVNVLGVLISGVHLS